MPKFSPKNLKAQFLAKAHRTPNSLSKHAAPEPPAPTAFPQTFCTIFLNPALHRLSWMNYINFVHFRFRTVQRLLMYVFLFMKKTLNSAIWSHHGADVMREARLDQVRRLWCGVRHQSFCRSMSRAEPECLTKFRETNQTEQKAHTSCQRHERHLTAVFSFPLQ